MPYKSKAKQRKYMAVWRKEHPTYMRDYCRKYYDKVTAGMKGAAADAAVPTAPAEPTPNAPSLPPS